MIFDFERKIVECSRALSSAIIALVAHRNGTRPLVYPCSVTNTGGMLQSTKENPNWIKHDTPRQLRAMCDKKTGGYKTIIKHVESHLHSPMEEISVILICIYFLLCQVIPWHTEYVMKQYVQISLLLCRKQNIYNNLCTKQRDNGTQMMMSHAVLQTGSMSAGKTIATWHALCPPLDTIAITTSIFKANKIKCSISEFSMIV